MVTSHFILVKFGYDDHITFRDSLETRLASLRKIHTGNGELMDRSQPSLTGKLQYERGDWEGISGQNKIDSTGSC